MSGRAAVHYIEPQWPAPPRVRAIATLRTGGVSTGRFASLNLAQHVGDDRAAVAHNRRLLRSWLGLEAEPLWLDQVHGTRVVEAAGGPAGPAVAPAADASFTRAPGRACVVMTADCLPVLFCNRAGTCVAAAHAGWRGLAQGILDSTLAALGEPAESLIAWLGPAIEQEAFEVGPEVRERFLARDPLHAGAFRANPRGRWQADLYALARRELVRAGVRAIHGGGFATYGDRARFFSYRRDGQTGRMAALVWLAFE